MHRVELKAAKASEDTTAFISWFLMHRVELKGMLMLKALQRYNIVPNVPCGVERR